MAMKADMEVVKPAARAYEQGGVVLAPGESHGHMAANVSVGAIECMVVVLHEPGGVCPKLTCMATKPVEMVEHVTVEVHEQGTCSAINTTSPLTKGTTCVKPASVAEKAALTKPEVLKSRAENEDGCTCKELLSVDATELSPNLLLLPLLLQECPAAGEHEGGHRHVLSL